MGSASFGGRSGGGGIRLVDELPYPAKRGSIVYVKANHQGPGKWLSADFDLTLTPGHVRSGGAGGSGAVIAGYSNIDSQVYGIFVDPGGTLDPLPPGLSAVFSVNNDGVLYLKILEGSQLLAQVGRVNLTVTFGGNDYVLGPAGGSTDEWVARSTDLVPSGDRWTVGTPVTIRVFVSGTDKGLCAGGLREIGSGGNPDRPEPVSEGYYHVDPETGEWVEGLGREAAGIPAAVLPQAGLSQADKSAEKWHGILVGLSREEAGADWSLRTVAGTEAVQAHTTITSGGTSLRIALDPGLAGAAGADGNAWQVDVNPANLSTDPSSARISRTNINQPAVLIVVQQSGRNFTQVAALVNAVAGLTATVTGTGSAAFPSTIARQSFAGGVDADELGVEYDPLAKTVTLEHLVGHTQAQIVTFLAERELDDDTTIYATLIAGSDIAAHPEAAPQAWPFIRILSQGSLPKPEVITLDFLLRILGLTGVTIGDILTGAAVSGSGASRIITVTHADGSNTELAVPDTVGGGGGTTVIGSNDGVITGASFATDGSTLTITRSVGNDIVVNVPTSLRTAAIAANSVTAAQARANTDAHRGEWQVRLGVSQDWSDIPSGTAIKVGKVVEHGDAFFGCITDHNRGGTGPDGDATNWILLSNYRGDWSAAWYPAGAFVRRSGLPYVATSAVTVHDPAPDSATNTKWLRLGSVDPSVVSYSANTIIPAANRGWTYRATGGTTRRLSLPNASGSGEVPNGWDVVVSNSSTADQETAPNGSDRIGGNALLTLAPGRSVRLQKVASGVWIIVADTKDETGTSDLPNVVNVSADTAIPDTAFGDTYRVTGNVSRTITLPDPDDVALGWFVRVANGSAAGTDHSVAREGSGQSIEGGNGPLTVPSGQSITIQKVNTNEWELIADTAKGAAATGGALTLSTALTDAQKKAWRAHFASWHLDVTDNSTLPAITNYNGPDGILLGQSGSTGVSFADISDRSTPLTAGVAGDLMLLLGRGWVRVGNLFTGGPAVAAVKAIADANKTAIDRLSVFGTAELSPGGVPDNSLPEFIGLRLDNKISDKTIAEIKVKIKDSTVTAISGAAVAPFNGFAVINNQSVGPTGGIINIATTTAIRDAFTVNTPTAAQYVRFRIEYKFEGTSLANNVAADAIDYMHFAVNNNGYPAVSGLSQSQVDARVLALRSLVATAATPAAGDRFFFTDENMAGDPLRYTDMYTLLRLFNRTYSAKAATAGASRTWTYTLASDDSQIWVGVTHRSGRFGRTIPRAELSATAVQFPLDHRNAGQENNPDSNSIGVRASISGNVLTLNSTGWANSTEPTVRAK